MASSEGQMDCKNDDSAPCCKKSLRRKCLSREPFFQVSNLKQRSAFRQFTCLRLMGREFEFSGETHILVSSIQMDLHPSNLGGLRNATEGLQLIEGS